MPFPTQYECPHLFRPWHIRVAVIGWRYINMRLLWQFVLSGFICFQASSLTLGKKRQSHATYACTHMDTHTHTHTHTHRERERERDRHAHTHHTHKHSHARTHTPHHTHAHMRTHTTHIHIHTNNTHTHTNNTHTHAHTRTHTMHMPLHTHHSGYKPIDGERFFICIFLFVQTEETLHIMWCGLVPRPYFHSNLTKV